MLMGPTRRPCPYQNHSTTARRIGQVITVRRSHHRSSRPTSALQPQHLRLPMLPRGTKIHLNPPWGLLCPVQTFPPASTILRDHTKRPMSLPFSPIIQPRPSELSCHPPLRHTQEGSSLYTDSGMTDIDLLHRTHRLSGKPLSLPSTNCSILQATWIVWLTRTTRGRQQNPDILPYQPQPPPPPRLTPSK